MPTATDAASEFASTYAELHYLAIGFAAGWTLGLWAGTKLTD